MVKYAFIAPICLLALLGCNKEGAPDCFQKAGSTATETRELTKFTQIHVRDFFTQITLMQAPEYRVEITGGKNLLGDIYTESDANGVLTLRNDNGCNFVRSFKNKLEITVYCPQLESIKLFEGAGDFSIPGPFAVDSLSIEGHDFVGLLEGRFAGRVVNAELHAGLGDVRLSGALDDLHLYNLGYGFVDTRQLTAQRAFTNNGSTNAMRLKAPGYLFAKITGRGNTYVSGTPDSYDALLTGEGELVFLP